MKLFNAVIVEDHLLVAESIKIVLKTTRKFNRISIFGSIDEARKELQSVPCDFLFTDLLMPGLNVKEFIRFARRNWPGLIIVVISSETDMDEIRSLFRLDINAYLSKSARIAEIKKCVEKTLAGDRYINSDLSSNLATSVFEGERAKLSQREIEIIRQVADGKSIVETAETLSISQHTVIAHRRNIMAKLGIHSAAEMVKYAFQHKLC